MNTGSRLTSWTVSQSLREMCVGVLWTLWFTSVVDLFRLHRSVVVGMKSRMRYSTRIYSYQVDPSWSHFLTIQDYKAKILPAPFISRLLALTLTTSPRLGQMVRRLTIKSDNCSKEEAKSHIDVLKMSPFLEDVTIIGYHEDFLSEYMDAFSHLHQLRTLHVFKCDPPFLLIRTFLNARDLLEILPMLPKMEEIGIVETDDDPNSRACLDRYCTKRIIRLHTR